MGKLKWGIIGTGGIAGELADGVNASTTGELLAVGSRAAATAAAFGDKYDVPRRYDSYEALLADAEVAAVYIATPHPWHAEWTIKAAEAGKHILVEKPIGMNAAEARAMVDAAERYDVFLMEAFMYRCHPQTQRLRELIAEGAIGEVRLIRASFAYGAAFDADRRTYNNDLGGGGILDVGCYPVSAARLIAGAAHGKPFLEPQAVKGCGHLCETGVDAYAAAVLRFDGDIIAEVSTGVGLNMHQAQTIEVFGSEGRILVADPWIPSRFDREPRKIIVTAYADRTDREVIVPCERDLYTCEADTVAANIAARQAPAMTWDDSLGNMDTLDRWRAEVGLVYDREKPERGTETIGRRPLVRRPGARIPHGRVPGLDKPVARLIQGADNNHTMPYTTILFDEYFACGGNAFDTSHGYGNPLGACERNLGFWLRHRGIRDEVVVIEKGGNPPFGTPSGILRECAEGLERLQLDYADLWLMHRDNPDVPVGELVDVMNELKAAGRCTIFGVSNWSLQRLQEAQAYAQANGREFFSVVSNQFSLAQLINDPWPPLLCLSCNDPEFRAWFEATQTPLFSWSSQSRGFFTDRAGRDKLANGDMVNCWYSDGNFEIRDRAYALAAKKGVEPVNIALAWVLAQPFPTFTLIGPRRHRELWSCLRALDVELTPAEMSWLETGR